MASQKSRRRRDKRRKAQHKHVAEQPAAAVDAAEDEPTVAAVAVEPAVEQPPARPALDLDWRKAEPRPIDEGMPAGADRVPLMRLRNLDDTERMAAIGLTVFCFIGLVVNSMVSLLLMAVMAIVVVLTDLRRQPALRTRALLSVVAMVGTFSLLRGNGDLEPTRDLAGTLFTLLLVVCASAGFWLVGDVMRRVAELRAAQRVSLPLFALGAANCTVAVVIGLAGALFLSTSIQFA